jgi:ribosome-binding protein aMBF1 (putative translation factor)
MDGFGWTGLALLTFTQRTIHVQKQPKIDKIWQKGAFLKTNTIGDMIVVERKRLSLTQEQLAQMTGIHRQWLGRWERNRLLPSTEEVEKLRQVLELCSV